AVAERRHRRNLFDGAYRGAGVLAGRRPTVPLTGSDAERLDADRKAGGRARAAAGRRPDVLRGEMGAGAHAGLFTRIRATVRRLPQTAFVRRQDRAGTANGVLENVGRRRAGP